MTDGENWDLAANVSLLFSEVPFLDRFRKAAEAGFQSSESWWPFGASAEPSHVEVDALVEAIGESGIPQTGMNLFAGDMPAGDRGLVSRPDRRDEFIRSLDAVERVARRTGCRGFNALYGQRVPGFSAEEQDAVAVDNLVAACRRLGDVGGTILIEPLAKGLNGEYPITTAEQAVQVIERVRDASGQENIGLLFDTFHLASNGEALVDVIRSRSELIAHVQLADAPGRGEPGSGDIDFPSVLSALWERGYRGNVAAEYNPTVPTVDSFGWVKSSPHLVLDRSHA